MNKVMENKRYANVLLQGGRSSLWLWKHGTFHIRAEIKRNIFHTICLRSLMIKKYKLENKCLKIAGNKLLVTLEDSLKPLSSRKNSLMYIIREQSFMVCQKCGCIHRI